MSSNLFVALAPCGGGEEVGRSQQRVLPEALMKRERRLLACAFLRLCFRRRKERELLSCFRLDMIRTEQDAADGMAGLDDACVQRFECIRDDGARVRHRVEADGAGSWRQEEIRARAVDDGERDGRRDDVARCEIQGELVGHFDEHDARLGIAVVAQEHLSLGDRLCLRPNCHVFSTKKSPKRNFFGDCHIIS